MVINPINSAITAWTAAALESAMDSWSLGSVMTARPMGLNPDGYLVLQIGALSVETEPPSTQLPPEFLVRVTANGTVPQLEMLALDAMPAEAVQSALLAKLPEQNGYAPMLATFAAISQGLAMPQIPPNLIAHLGELEQSIRSPMDLADPITLQKAILQSGLFLEAHLADLNTDPELLAEGDWKANLLQIAAALDEYLEAPPQRISDTDTPPPLFMRGMDAQARVTLPMEWLALDAAPLLARLQGDVHAAIARLEVAQLEAATTTPTAWMIEIPVKGEDGYDILQMSIRQGEAEAGAEGEESEESWVFGFAIDLPALGPIQGELTLRRRGLSVRLWTKRASTVMSLEHQFNEMRHRLSQHGIVLNQLTCHLGLRERDDNPSTGFLKATA